MGTKLALDSHLSPTESAVSRFYCVPICHPQQSIALLHISPVRAGSRQQIKHSSPVSTALRYSCECENFLTVNSGMFFSIASSPPSRNVPMVVRRTGVNTSIWWHAVDTDVISPWYPASEISWNRGCDTVWSNALFILLTHPSSSNEYTAVPCGVCSAQGNKWCIQLLSCFVLE